MAAEHFLNGFDFSFGGPVLLAEAKVMQAVACAWRRRTAGVQSVRS
jgi:hypothetical protein